MTAEQQPRPADPPPSEESTADQFPEPSLDVWIEATALQHDRRVAAIIEPQVTDRPAPVGAWMIATYPESREPAKRYLDQAHNVGGLSLTAPRVSAYGRQLSHEYPVYRHAASDPLYFLLYPDRVVAELSQLEQITSKGLIVGLPAMRGFVSFHYRFPTQITDPAAAPAEMVMILPDDEAVSLVHDFEKNPWWYETFLELLLQEHVGPEELSPYHRSSAQEMAPLIFLE